MSPPSPARRNQPRPTHDKTCADLIRTRELGAAGTPTHPDVPLLHHIAHTIVEHCGHRPLKAHRLAWGWTVKQAVTAFHTMCEHHKLGKRGLGERSWQGWEAGNYRPDDDYLDRLARLFCTNIIKLGYANDHTPRPTKTTPIASTTPGGPVVVGGSEHSTVALPLASAIARRLADVGRGGVLVLATPPGRFFAGQQVQAHLHPAVDDGRVLAAVPPDYLNNAFLRRPQRGLVIGLVGDDEHPRGYGLDSRQARRRLAKAGSGSRLLIPPGYLLDDVAMGILWAVTNLDEPLLYDDGLLTALHRQVAGYEDLQGSSAGGDLAAELTTVSRMWLGSDFCARHILRHLDGLANVPSFWTREQRGEEASTWLLFRHKYHYLKAVTDRFTGAALSRAFCIPADTVAASPIAERVLLLLAAALMESFAIRVNLCTDPEYAGMEGFVLDGGRQAIVANWVGAEGIWQVGVTSDRPTITDYGECLAQASVHSAIAGPSPSRRLRAMADYLQLDWAWLVQRCRQLGSYGSAGLVEPRSRLLSVDGLDRACQYLGQLAAASD